MSFTIVNVNFPAELDKKALKRVAKEAFLFLGDDFEVNLKIVGEEEIQRLNKKYAGKDTATDVLSFKLEENQNGGDILISPLVKKDAREWKCAVWEAACLLFAHGILHLAGHEHTKEEERAKMESAEREILKNAGIKIRR